MLIVTWQQQFKHVIYSLAHCHKLCTKISSLNHGIVCVAIEEFFILEYYKSDRDSPTNILNTKTFSAWIITN